MGCCQDKLTNSRTFWLCPWLSLDVRSLNKVKGFHKVLQSSTFFSVIYVVWFCEICIFGSVWTRSILLHAQQEGRFLMKKDYKSSRTSLFRIQLWKTLILPIWYWEFSAASGSETLRGATWQRGAVSATVLDIWDGCWWRLILVRKRLILLCEWGVYCAISYPTYSVQVTEGHAGKWCGWK